MQPDRAQRRFLGITVLADFIICEGVDRVLENVVERAGATAVALNPTVTAPSETGVGSFQPPTDAGSSPRLFDRPLWGRRSLWVRGAPSYHPRLDYYKDCAYRPRQSNELTETYGYLVSEFIDKALAQGLSVFFQIGAAQPRGLLPDDVPRLPDGRLPQGRMANTASLASEAVRSYNRAYLRDLLEAYPQITGFRPDWPEYPCYTLDEAFQDFSAHVHAWADAHGFDFQRVRQEVKALYASVHGGLRNQDLLDLAGPDRGRFSQIALLRRHPGVLEWLRLKAALSVDMLRHWRQTITEFGGEDKELSANAFMPPFSLCTGFDFAAAADYCSAVSPKLYTMHWSVMVEFWGRVLLDSNPELEESLVVRALANLFDLGDETTAEGLSDYGYPGPDEAHPIPDAPQARKIEQVLAQVGGRTQVTPLVHGYGPLHDFRRRFLVVANSAADGAWVNRYGYLSDEKLDVIGECWR
jgi:hypothetical protein